VPYPQYGTGVEGWLRYQSFACGQLGSPLYEDLLERAADDYVAKGPTWELLAGHEEDPGGSALALRLMGSVHRLVLAGAAPELARRYRPGETDRESTWSAFRDVLVEHRHELARLVEHQVQTNEVGRCAALLPGFLRVAERSGMPLRLLEVGASAGLNLRWDEYRYEAAGFSWGPRESPLRIAFELSGGRLPDVPATVAERAACDASPLDPAADEDRQTLLSYVWADQAGRMARLRAALEVAAAHPAPVARRGAVEWAAERLAQPASGLATVVFHSVVMQYLSEDEREAFARIVEEAGSRAGEDAPLAWLRMEPDGDRAAVRLAQWPEGEDRPLARAGYHGNPVQLAG